MRIQTHGRLFAAIVSACPAVASATNYIGTYTPTGSAAWNTAADWSNSPTFVGFPNNNGTNGNTWDAVINGVGTGTTEAALSTDITIDNFNFSNADLVGTAANGSTGQGSPTTLNVLGSFTNGNAGASIRLLKGVQLNLEGASTINSANLSTNIDGDSNAIFNVASGGVFTHNDSGSATFYSPSVNVVGTMRVLQGVVVVNNSIIQLGTINTSAGATLVMAGNFAPSSVVNDSGEFDLLCSPGGIGVAGIDGSPGGHQMSGTVNVASGANLGFLGGGGGAVSVAAGSHVNFAGNDSLTVTAGGAVAFNDADDFSLNTVTLAGEATFRNRSLSISILNLSGSNNINTRFETTGTAAGTTIGLIDQAGGSIYTGQDDGYAVTPVGVTTYNLSGGVAAGRVVVSGTFNWTGGVIGSNYGDVVISPGATANITAAGGVFQQLGKLENLGGTFNTTNPLIVNGISGASSFQQTTGTTNIQNVLAIGNNGTANGNSGAANGTANISGGTLFANSITQGNANGGTGTLVVAGTGQVNVAGGVQSSDTVVTGGSLTVLNGSSPAGTDPELSHAIVGGYITNGTINVSGGAVTTPMIKLGISTGLTGTFQQTGGTVNVTTIAAGNDANISSGSGTGVIDVGGGLLNVSGGIMLGSTAGGGGTLLVHNAGRVTASAISLNGAVVTGGSLTVTNSSSSASTDTVLSYSIVGGYQRNGDLTISGGSITSPYLKLGVTSPYVGTYSQTGGIAFFTSAMGIGNNGASSGGNGYGSANISGGVTAVANLVVGSTTGGIGTVIVGGTGQLTVTGSINVLPGSSLTINSAGSVSLSPRSTNYSASSIAGFTMNGGTFDISDNAVDLPGGNLSTVVALISSGSVFSSAAAGDTRHATSVGAILNDDGHGHPIYAPGLTTPPDPKNVGLFRNQAPALDDVLIAYTYAGDSNLDGKIDGSDYSLIDAGYLSHATGWYRGDFNYDGKVDGSDYTLIDNGFNRQAASLFPTALIASPAAVPEPVTLGSLLLTAPLLGRRTKRQRFQSMVTPHG